MQTVENTTVENVPEIKDQLQEVKETKQTQEQVETPAQINWRKFREQREIERKEKEAIERKYKEKEQEALALKNAMEAVLNKNTYSAPQTEEREETEDERIQKKIDQALQARERALEQQRAEQEKALLPKKLTDTYSDFNQVCSQENIDYLEYHYPEIAQAFENQPDSFNKWANVYKAVKKLIPNHNSAKDEKKAQQNFNKPQSMSVSGVTQTGDNAPKFLDERRKQENYERMLRVMKGGR